LILLGAIVGEWWAVGKATALPVLRGRGRPPLSGKPKTAITLRLDEDVVEAYRETGDGWQTRINADLRRARKLRTAVAPRRGGAVVGGLKRRKS
jgi:hypothetical protein